jgi:hypothetical protein
LARFVVEQRGNNVRVIDSDQSVYDGALSNEAALGGAAAAPEPASGQAQQLKQESLAAAGRRSFRASGTNRSSGQLVVFDGQLPSGNSQQTFVLLPQSDERRSRVAAQAISSNARLPSLASSPLARVAAEAVANTNALLEGSVRVGGGAPQQLRAIRVQQ